jgi:hypothetical protein
MRLATRSFVAIVVLTLALLLSTTSASAAAKKYQVTGKVLEVTDKMIVVQTVKGDERWEIERTPDTKVDGDLKVGQKVTIEYRMMAASVEVKSEK